MPTYEYVCRSCDNHLEVVQRFDDEALSDCPSCGGALRKVFGSIGISFKGSGFYKTDSRALSKTGGGPGRGDDGKDGKNGKEGAKEGAKEGTKSGADNGKGSGAASADSGTSGSATSGGGATGTAVKESKTAGAGPAAPATKSA